MELELREIFRVMFKRFWIIALLTAFTAGIAAYASFYVLDPVYESNTTLYVLNKQSDAQAVIAYNDMLVGQQLVKDYRELIKSRTITTTVIQELELKDVKPEQLADRITVSAKNDTRVIEIKVQDTDPTVAQKIAEKVSNVFMEKIKNIMQVENVDVIDQPQLPDEPVKPRPLMNIALGLFAGFLLGLGLVFLIEYLDDTIKTSEDVERYLQLNVLGTIPTLNLK